MTQIVPVFDLTKPVRAESVGRHHLRMELVDLIGRGYTSFSWTGDDRTVVTIPEYPLDEWRKCDYRHEYYTPLAVTTKDLKDLLQSGASPTFRVRVVRQTIDVFVSFTLARVDFRLGDYMHYGHPSELGATLPNLDSTGRVREWRIIGDYAEYDFARRSSVTVSLRRWLRNISMPGRGKGRSETR